MTPRALALATAASLAATLLAAAPRAEAHCDSMTGPVVVDAKSAIADRLVSARDAASSIAWPACCTARPGSSARCWPPSSTTAFRCTRCTRPSCAASCRS